MKKRANGIIEAIGTVLIDDILEEYNIAREDIGIIEEYMGEPVSYIIMAEQEEFPVVGTEVVFSGEKVKLIFRVIRVDETVIEKIECEKVDIA
jgi:Transporter associated domain